MLYIVDVVKKKTKRAGITKEDARNCVIYWKMSHSGDP